MQHISCEERRARCIKALANVNRSCRICSNNTFVWSFYYALCKLTYLNILNLSTMCETLLVAVSMSQEAANSAGRRIFEMMIKVATVTACKRASAYCTQTKFGLLPKKTLEKYGHYCSIVMVVKEFYATREDYNSLVVYDRNCFERDIDLRVWEQRWAVLSRWCVGILVVTFFADMWFGRCKEKCSFCGALREGVLANTEAAERDFGLLCWSLDNLDTNFNSMYDRTHQTKAPEPEIC